jgi:hypothetical protein
MKMAVYFSNEDYKKTCEEEGFQYDNLLSQSAVEVAYECSRKMKYFMDAKKGCNDPVAIKKIDKEIKKWDERRLEFMLNALFYAEIMNGLGEGADEFYRKIFNERK